MMGTRLETRKTVPGGIWARVRRALRRARGEQGTSLVEFALVSTLILFPLLMGIITFGSAFSNYLSLTNGTNIAAQAMAISRGVTAPNETYQDPCLTAYDAFHNSSQTLNPLNLSYTITIYTSATASQAFSGSGGSWSCSGSGAADMTAGMEAQIQVSYPVYINFIGFNLCPTSGCTISSTVAEVVQ